MKTGGYAVVLPLVRGSRYVISLDNKDLYVNIPIQETLHITKVQLNTHNDKKTTHQIVTLLNTILRQNYFSFHGQIYQPDKGVAMGLPISGTMAELFLQHLENSIIKHLTDTRILHSTPDTWMISYSSTTPHAPTQITYYNTSIPSTTTSF